MRKNRVLTDALREVRHTLSRFFSIFLLSALAVAFLAGLRATAPDMEYSADAYFDALGLMDVRVLSTLGVSEDDVAALAAQPGVRAAEGSYTVDALLHLEDNDLILKAHSISGRGINRPMLREGRMPENDGECLVEPALLEKAGISLGDTITLDTGDGDMEDALKHGAFTVVGTADWPLYISVERGSSTLGTGRVSAFVLLPEGAFGLEAYTEAYLVADGAAELLCYGGAYEDLTGDLIDALKPLGEERAGLRYGEVVGEANEKLSDAQKEYDDAKADADRELEDARIKLEDARAELDDGWAEYGDGKATLARETADARRKIADAEAELPGALADLEQGEADYADGVQELADGRAEYNDGAAALWSGRKDYDEGYQTLLDGEAEYQENYGKLLDGEAEYADGYAQYVDGLAELEDGGRQLMDADAELQKGLDGLFAGGQQLSQGREQLAQQKNIYAMQAAGYQAVAGDWEKRGIYTLGDTPQVTGPKLGGYLGQLLQAGDMAGLGGFYGQGVAPLKELLGGQIQMAAAQGQDTSQLEALYSALPDDALGLLLMFRDAPEQAVAALTGAFYAPGEVLAQMGAAIEAGEAQLSSGESQLESGRWQYEAGKEQYEKARQEYLDGVAKALEAQAELDDARAELDDGWAQLGDGRRELDDGWADLSDAKAELADGQKELDEAWIKLVDGEQELTDARAELDDGWRQYRDGVAELADAKQELPREIAKAEQKLSDALAELTDGEQEYADGLREYRDGKAEAEQKLSDARRELNDARRKISEIGDCKWYILGRNTNTGYVSFSQDAERMGNLASVFPIIFFLVAALVCLTTMTRMVEEQRVQIGCMKALGYGKGTIAFKYVGYGFFASLLGAAAGLWCGCAGIPAIIFNAWKILYTVGELKFQSYPAVNALAVAAAVCCVTGAAVAACIAELTAVPAELMRPKAPPAGKRVLLERVRPVWKRLSFSHKVTVRNLLRYKKRFWMTVIGIGGCTALIVTGFGLRDSIYDILDKQYDEISTYSANVGLVDDVTADELAEISGELDGSGLVEEWMPSYQTSLSVESGKRSVDGYLFAVSDTERFRDFIHLRHRLDHSPVALPEEGAVLTEKLAALLGVGVGDTVTLDGDERVEVPVVEITENYVFHYVYITGSYYEKLYGEAARPNTLMVTYTEDTKENADAVASGLIPLSGVTAVSRIRDARATFSKSMESVDYAVILIICCAAALAFVVLYNLTNINITERLRELATLKVLGFYDRELSAYVYRENVLLTVFGVALGLVMGKFLHQWLVLTVEIDMVMFGRQARPMSYLYAVGLTVLFSALVNLAARRRLRRIDMVESLKTVE